MRKAEYKNVFKIIRLNKKMGTHFEQRESELIKILFEKGISPEAIARKVGKRIPRRPGIILKHLWYLAKKGQVDLEKVRQYGSQYHLKKRADYRRKNSERINQRKRRRLRTDVAFKERAKLSSRNYFMRNRDRVVESCRRYRNENKERINFGRRLRRSYRRNIKNFPLNIVLTSVERVDERIEIKTLIKGQELRNAFLGHLKATLTQCRLEQLFDTSCFVPHDKGAYITLLSSREYREKRGYFLKEYLNFLKEMSE